jgi:hypothetical protein
MFAALRPHLEARDSRSWATRATILERRRMASRMCQNRELEAPVKPGDLPQASAQ